MSDRLFAVRADLRTADDAARWRHRLAADEFDALLIGTGDGPAALDPSAFAAALTGALEVPIIVEAAIPDHDPYNLARRVLSLQRIHSARVSLLLRPGGIDPLTLTARELAGEEHRGSEGSPAEIWREYVRVLRELWGSLPLGNLTADQDSGVFAEPGAIAPISFTGDFYRVAGPLNAPVDDTGIPHIYARVTTETQPSLIDAFIDEADAVLGDLPPTAIGKPTAAVVTEDDRR